MRPDAFAAVMATGIVSIAAADHGVEVVSVPLAVVAAVALPVLIVATARAWHRDSWDLRDLDTAVALFTYVAACAVLVARFDEHEWVVLCGCWAQWRCRAGCRWRPSSFGTCGGLAGPACATGRTAGGSWRASRPPGWPSYSSRRRFCSGR